MPLALVDPMVPAEGAGIPNGPLQNAFGAALTAYGRNFPTQLERTQMNVNDAQAQHLQQQNAAGQNLSNIFSNALTTPTSAPSDTTTAAPMPDGMYGPGAPVTTHNPGVSTGDVMRQNLPNLVRAAADSGDPTKASQLALLMSSNLAGTTPDITNQKPGQPTTQDLSMMAAGHPFAATPGGVMTERAMGTPEMRNRNAKIQQIMAANPNATQQQASNIVDGVVEGGLDPVTRQPYLLNKLDLMGGGNGGQPAPAADGAAASGPNPNNPFNLRPLNSQTGFQTFGSPQEGIIAGMKDLNVKLSGQSGAMKERYGPNYVPSLRNIISTYSPPNENATTQLIQNAAKRMNIDPDAPLGPQHIMPLSEAILAQEQGAKYAQPSNPPATIPGAAPSAAAPVQPLAAEDLNIPFDKMYGGGAAVSGISGGIDALTGSPNANQDRTDGFSAASRIINKLNQINSLKANNKSGASGTADFMKQFPETDPQLLEREDMAKGATTSPGTAGSQLVTGLKNAAIDYKSDLQFAGDPANNPDSRKAAQDRAGLFKQLLAELPGPAAAKLAAQAGITNYTPSGAPATPIAAPKPPTNLEAGTALTQPSSYKSIADVVKAVQAGIITRAQGKTIAQQQFGDH